MAGYKWKVSIVVCLLLACLPAAAYGEGLEQLPSLTRRYYTTKPVLAEFEVGGFVVSFSLILVDEPLHEIMHSRDPLPREVWKGITWIGDPLFHLALGFAGVLMGSEVGTDLFYACLYNDVNTAAIKVSTGMARPKTGVSTVFTGPSFNDDFAAMPSGHTSSSFAAARALAEHFPEWKPVLYTAAAAVGLSRIFLDEHWPSNVALGALIGYLSAKHYLHLKKEPQQ